MKVVNLKDFMLLPNGTIFSEGEEIHGVYETYGLYMKTGKYIENRKPYLLGVVEILDYVYYKENKEIKMKIEEQDIAECDYDINQKFLIYDKYDVMAIIKTLQDSLEYIKNKDERIKFKTISSEQFF